ncbi:molybdenum ABC transporter ATP-binding protein [Marinibactrum halimedae]|uniref:Molybdenum import ATP-binding protein ModC n=1 Tax=Marinibactrum halimedae TaxID=1444977 RepID=A0AA37T3M4_9GAMM|nr:molybdenum ABC transporter ATP-binding protein [Marinibactrum halimedae]MCD9461266.1 molybdenum ABC transporter ATP-binding protein [Marinibactrum halimedae]GLS26198.1 molybdenum import ATP-binding protein ModC [Marinibactrum halimedae]
MHFTQHTSNANKEKHCDEGIHLTLKVPTSPYPFWESHRYYGYAASIKKRVKHTLVNTFASTVFSDKKTALPFSLSGQYRLTIETDIPGQGITAIFGPSGSGKTTLLRCLAGLECVPNSKVQFKGSVWQSPSQFIPPNKRPIGMVFQEPSLFSHLTVEENLRYAIKRAKPFPSHGSATPNSEINKNVINKKTLVELLGIEHLLNHNTKVLSGGERQRVAMARTLLTQPQLLLMDEPLSALDAARKQEVLPYLERLKEELNIPVVYVSHSVEEVSRLADHLMVIENGECTAAGSIHTLPLSPSVHFQSESQQAVIIDAFLSERDTQYGLIKADFPGGHLWVKDSGNALHSPQRLQIQAKDVSIALTEPSNTSVLNRLPVVITEIRSSSNAMATLVLTIGNDDNHSTQLLAQVTKRSVDNLGLQTGMPVWAMIKSIAIAR